MELAAQRFALPTLGQGQRSRPARKMLRRRKLLENAAESPASGARFVGRRFERLFCRLKIIFSSFVMSNQRVRMIFLLR